MCGADAATHVGVLGTSNQYAGVEGISKSGQGVWGQSTSGPGVQGNSTAGTGVSGSSTTADGVLGYTAGNTLGTAGVLGVAGNRTNFNGIAAVWGDSASNAGVYGSSTQYAGVYGASTNGNGIQGYSANGTGGDFQSGGNYATVTATNTSTTAGLGLIASSLGTDAEGVLGWNTAGGTGVFASVPYSTAIYGEDDANSGIGVEGFSHSIGIVGRTVKPSVVGIGFENEKEALWADSGVDANNKSANIDVASLTAFADDNRAGYMINNSNEYPSLYLQNNGSGGTIITVNSNVLRATGKGGSCAVSSHGDLSCTGQVKTLATTSGARKLETYVVHSPENWVEDFGSGTLQNGSTTILIGSMFAEVANTAVDYHILLTPRGDTRTLFVTNLSASSFEVHESGHGTSTVAFDYRIVARRKGYEGQRLNDVTEALHAENARYELPLKNLKQGRQSVRPVQALRPVR